jgi:tetratricopeptide (TPR) repeat protein
LNDGTQHPLYWALLDAAELKLQGRFFEALQRLHEALIRRFTAASESAAMVIAPTPIDLLALEDLTDLSVLFHQTEAADDLLTGIGLWYERAGNRYYADYFTVKRAHLAIDAGRLEDGYQILRDLEPSLGQLESIDYSDGGFWERKIEWRGAKPLDRAIFFAQFYLEIGRLLCGFGQYFESLAAIERGLQHAALVPPEVGDSSTLHLQTARATALLERGDFEQADQRLDELQAALNNQQWPGLSTRCLELKGKLHLLKGEFGNALQLFQRALQTCRDLGFDRAALIAGLNLAHVLIYLNQTGVARRLLTRIGDCATELNDQRIRTRAGLLLQMAQARGHSLAEAVPIAPSVSESWGLISDAAPDRTGVPPIDPFDLPQSDSYLSFFEDRALGFHWHLGRRDFDAAAAYLSEIKQVFELSDSDLIHLRLQIMSGMLAYYRQELRRASLIFDELRTVVRRRGLKPELWQALRFLSWCWVQLGGGDSEARNRLENDTQELLDEMTASLPREDQAVFLLNKWTENEEFLASEIHRLATLKTELEKGSVILRPWRRWRLMERLHKLMLAIDRHKRALARDALSSRAPEDRDDLNLSLLRRLVTHPPDRVTLSFLVLPDQVFIARSGWFELDFGVSPITRLQVRDLVRRWHESIRAILGNDREIGSITSPDQQPELGDGRGLGSIASASRPSDIEPEADRPPVIDEMVAEGRQVTNRLAEALQIPAILNSLPTRIRALTIVPDDSLHGFPFAAITYKERFLIEHYALSLAFESLSRGSSAGRGVVPAALAVGVSRGANQVFPEFSVPLVPLPGAARELDSVIRWLTKHRRQVFRLDDSASGFEPANKTRLIELLPRVGLFHIACHGIFKTDAPDRSGLALLPNPSQLEVFSLRELSELDLRALQHATLSSCWSADHFILPGRWVIGLPETMWRAGASSVLGCLWVVNDDLGVKFMQRFYEYLDVYPRDEALRQTQLAFLEIEGQASLYYWAGYNLYGDYSPLKH